MSTRFSKKVSSQNAINLGYEGNNVPEGYKIASCKIEDIDRALFNLFNVEIPFYYERKKEQKRVPVIFATGERFAILRRKRPLRDKAGATILPLISILRSSIEQDNDGRPGQTLPLTIKKRLDKSDPVYQRWLNKQALKNQPKAAAENHKIENETATSVTTKGQGTEPGTIATRKTQADPTLAVQKGELLKSDLGRNIYEIIEIPPTKLFTINYNVTFWAQYMQQANSMLGTLMSAYQDNNQRTFRLETPAGYWFVAYVNATLNSEDNFDQFAEEERMIRYSFDVKVPGYLVLPQESGMPSGLRSYYSAVDISFGIADYSGELQNEIVGGPPSGNPADYILADLADENDPFPGQAIGVKAIAGSDSRDLSKTLDAVPNKTVELGGATAGKMLVRPVTLKVDPFTGKTLDSPAVGRTISTQGETVYKDLNTGKINPDERELIELDI
jgi:hypothetical protein